MSIVKVFYFLSPELVSRLQFYEFLNYFALRGKTPLDTLEVMSSVYGSLLATPFLNAENTESGDTCFWTGTNDGDYLWTDRCNTENSWQAWILRPVNGNTNRFQLVHNPTNRCAKPVSNDSNSYVTSVAACTTDSSMVWSWVDGA